MWKGVSLRGFKLNNFKSRAMKVARVVGRGMKKIAMNPATHKFIAKVAPSAIAAAQNPEAGLPMLGATALSAGAEALPSIVRDLK